ncbi:hypothetical protein [Flavobacterium suzhouense]|uniref:Uncharacterized protein n=1 Tax=Flavobacterium suzhouense TaxID=1529638 RepID=A0ABW5NPI6_9FLAO
MKTHLKLTVVLFVAVAALFLLISRNHKSFSGRSNNVTVLNNSSSEVLKQTKKVDSLEFKRLISYFKLKRDEFDPSGTIRYMPETSPEKPKGNAIFCYFDQTDDLVANLRLRMQVENKEWLFYKRCQFLIDGKIFDYIPSNIEFNQAGTGNVCEWFDNAINENNFVIVKALSKAKIAKVKILGRNYDKVIVFTDKDIASIDHTLELYSAMNGEFAFN